jgi:hypothetical protein
MSVPKGNEETLDGFSSGVNFLFCQSTSTKKAHLNINRMSQRFWKKFHHIRIAMANLFKLDVARKVCAFPC